MIYNAERQRETYQRRVNYCEEQIRRLRAVYDELGEIKDEFRQTRKSTERIFEEKGKWRGRRYQDFCNAGEKLDSSYGAYYRKLDAAQDAVNTKMGELLAEQSRLIPLIGGLVAQIQRWWIDIENLGN